MHAGAVQLIETVADKGEAAFRLQRVSSDVYSNVLAEAKMDMEHSELVSLDTESIERGLQPKLIRWRLINHRVLDSGQSAPDLGRI